MTGLLPADPSRKSSMQFVNPAMKPYLISAPENFGNALKKDNQFWADYGDQLKQRFEVWLAR
jgi:putative spermidine/putrescine transport system substrate-binding protein